jgi:hypothetical protein
MFVFSVSAKATKAIDEFAEGDIAPFIVYINFKDLHGAEALCKLFVMREGFKEVTIEKRQMISEEKLADQRIVDADKGLKEALKTGYALQLFSS